MNKTYFKNLFRDIKKTMSRFLSIVIIIAIGVAFYAGVRATSPDMKISGDAFFKSSNFMDFKLMSNLGLTDGDVAEIKKVNGVASAEGAYSVDGIITKNKTSLVVNINSMPGDNGINQIRIVSGREPRNNGEALSEDNFLRKNGYKVGDTIVIDSGNDTDIRNTLKKNQLKIVGSAESPLYLSEQRQLSSVGNGSVKGFIYVLSTNFKNDVFTEVYVKCKSSSSLNSLLNHDAYKSEMDSVKTDLKDLITARGKLRYDQIIDSGVEKTEDAENRLGTSKAQAESKLSSAFHSLDSGKAELEKANTELQRNIADFNNKSALGAAEIANALASLNKSEADLNLGKAAAYESISQGLLAKVQEAGSALRANPGSSELAYQYNMLSLIYNKDIKDRDFDSMYEALKQDGALEQINTFVNVEALKKGFDDGADSISLGRRQIEEKQALLRDGQAKLQQSQLKIDVSQSELDTSEIALNAENIKSAAQLAAAENTIQINKEKLYDIKTPEVYVLDRSENVGYESYRQDSDRIDNIGRAFPLIFFLVSALVSLTTMTRMVQENRIEIGTFKALGYSRFAIVSHYLIYALSASLTGSLLGISFGFRLFPPLIMNAYSSLYTIPDSVTPFNISMAVKASLIAVLFTVAAAGAATLEELREVPAALMRPKPPKAGKRILLERIGFIWNRLSFTKKVTARNIFRYKSRFLMTVIGIAACTGLMITGYSLKGAILGSTENQFNKIYRYNLQASLTKDMDDAEKSNIKAKLNKDSNIDSVLFAYNKNVSAKNTSNNAEDAHVVVPERKGELYKYIDLTYGGKPLELSDDGVILTDKFAKLINKKAGDTFILTIDDKDYAVKVSSVTEHYIQHYIYMSSDYYSRVTGKKLQYNSFYGLLKSITADSENLTSKTLSDISRVGSFSFKNNIYLDFSKTMKSIDSVVLVLIFSAGVLAFVVIFNLTNININERRRELATIKLLGFYNSELAAYIYRENIILTLIGCVAGIGAGILLNRFVINTAETNILMFYRGIDPIYFLYSILLTILFSIIVNLAMYNRFDKIDMIESLKSAE